MRSAQIVLIIWLVFLGLMFGLNLIADLIYLFIEKGSPRELLPAIYFETVGLVGIFGIVWSKKWGFIVFSASLVPSFLLNLLELQPLNCVPGLVLIILMFSALQIGGDRKAWSQLT